MSDEPFPARVTVGRTNDGRVVAWLFFGLVLLAGGLYIAGFVLTGDRVPRGTSIAGVPVGGLRPAAARHTLARGLRSRVDRPVTVSARGRRYSIDPSRAGIGVDIEASVSQAQVGRSWDPGRIWNYLVGGEDYEADITVDRSRLTARLRQVAEQVDRPVREGQVRLHAGTATARRPEPGVQLDVPRAGDAVAAAYLGTDHVVPLPVRAVQPTITDQDVSTAMSGFANRATAGPVGFRLAGRTVDVPPEDFTRALSMRAQDGALVPALDEQALRSTLGPALAELVREPRNAKVRVRHGEPTVVPASRGVRYDPQQVEQQFLTTVKQQGSGRTMRLDAVPVRPGVTTEDARRLAAQRQQATGARPHRRGGHDHRGG